MIYLDTSVALAQLFAEDRRPPAWIWTGDLVSSRLLEYELWNRMLARNLVDSRGDAARGLLGRVAFLELALPVLARALEAFPVPVRTLDSLHLASLDYLRRQAQRVELASYDRRMIAAARAIDIPVCDLER